MATLLARGQAMKTYGVLLLLLIHSRLFLPESCMAATARSLNSENDKEALLAFKRNLDNDSPVLSSWNESIPYCKWGGVYCCHRHLQRVCALELRSSGLVGPISPYIGNLSYLKSIDLAYNKLYGIVPVSIGRLHRLQRLRLRQNFLSGPFPANLDNCSQLVYLSLPFNQFSGKLPSWLGHFRKLKLLYLEHNNFAGAIPLSITNLSSLQVVELGNNNLFGSIPSGLGQLSQLQEIYLGTNNFSGFIPESLLNLTNLAIVALELNNFHGHLPRDMGTRLSNLKKIYLGGNQLIGEIPASLSNASFIRELNLVTNNLFGSIPSGLGKLSQLQIIDLGANNFSGFIPESLLNLTNLAKVGLEYNNFHGHLPRDMGNRLSNLKIIYLNNNQLIGEIPASLSNASFIQVLDFGNNKFSGTMPIEIGKLCPTWFGVYSNNIEAKVTADWNFVNFFSNCSSLQYLDLSYNKLGGLFPSAIANLTSQLQYLYLTSNYIIGEIPLGIENLSGLLGLDLSDNQLTGFVPAGIGKFQKLQVLSIDGNNFSGPIPFTIGNLSMLAKFEADRNHLIGSIPSSIGNLTHLTELSLSHNALTGMLPKSMFDMKALSIQLDLSYNFLSGKIPKEVGMFVNLGKLIFSRNLLSGELPEELGSCQLLTILALDDNSFQGTIPSFLIKLKGLEILNISSNNFSGAIPQELGLLNELQELYLAENNLSGQIPLAIENLTHLYKLDISYNNIEGSVPEKGVFSNASALVLIGNNRLCGGIPELHLQLCLIQHDRNHSPMMLKLFILIAIILFFLAFLLLALLIPKWKRRLTRKSITNSLQKDKLLKVSYGELVEATGSFAASNLIGAGKYSHVYKGVLLFSREESSNQEAHTVAIKVFDLQQLGSSKSFMAECEALRLIRHRNLIQIRTCCSTIDYNGNDFKALVFDFVPNGNLHNWLHPEIDQQGSLSPLSLIQRLNITIDVVDALDYLHHNCQPSVIHCDLKPSNILLSKDFGACIGDFGLAKLLPDPISKSLVESESSIGIRGSIGYVPPEYGEGCPVSTAGDVYSFGVLLLEMITGRNPTEYMFKDGLTLHNFVKMAFPERVMDIVDPNLIPVDMMESSSLNKMCECVASIIKVGLTCSKPSPVERMSMQDAAIQLHKIRDIYLANRNR